MMIASKTTIAKKIPIIVQIVCGLRVESESPIAEPGVYDVVAVVVSVGRAEESVYVVIMADSLSCWLVGVVLVSSSMGDKPMIVQGPILVVMMDSPVEGMCGSVRIYGLIASSVTACFSANFE